MTRVVGWVLLMGGVGHIATGYVVFREQLVAIFRAGFVNAILPHFDRRAAFWFILFGVMVSMSGHIVLAAGATLPRWHEGEDREKPRCREEGTLERFHRDLLM